jgi:CheY-like chemotaxis protein
MKNTWKIMVVDDDAAIHDITQMSLRNFSYLDKQIEFLHAYSAQEAKKLIAIHPDIAVILLDVVMEHEQAGLEVVKYIRDELRNPFIRIILQTAQYEQAPERQVILEYDVNDYKEKREISTKKLFTSLVTALRTYQDMMTIHRNRLGLQKLIEATATIFGAQSIDKFISGILEQLLSILNLNSNAFYCYRDGSIEQANDDAIAHYIILAGTGLYEKEVGKYVTDVVEAPILNKLRLFSENNQNLCFDEECIIHLKHSDYYDTLIYLNGTACVDEVDKQLIKTFCANVAIAYDKLFLNQNLVIMEKKLVELLNSAVESNAIENNEHIALITEYLSMLSKKYGVKDEMLS